MNYSIRGVPTMILFKGGQVQDTQVGAVPKGKVTAMVDKVL
jgi:thioredoxin 1